MATNSDYAVAREADDVLRLDRTTESYPGAVAYIKPIRDRSGQIIGWRLKPLVVMQGAKSRVWPSAADAIAATKLLTPGQARAAVTAATGREPGTTS